MKQYIKMTIVPVEHEDEESQLSIVSDPNTSPEILARLSNSVYDSVVAAVLSNPNTPVEVLSEFAEKCLNGHRTNTKDYLCPYLVDNPSLPQEFFTKFANSNIAFMRSAVARNSTTPKEVLMKLNNPNESAQVRRSLLHNPNISSEMYNNIMESIREDILIVFELVIEATEDFDFNQFEIDVDSLADNLVWKYAAEIHSVDMGVSTDTEIEYENDGISVCGATITTTLIPEFYACDELCEEFEQELTNMGYHVLEIGYSDLLQHREN